MIKAKLNLMFGTSDNTKAELRGFVSIRGKKIHRVFFKQPLLLIPNTEVSIDAKNYRVHRVNKHGYIGRPRKLKEEVRFDLTLDALTGSMRTDKSPTVLGESLCVDLNFVVSRIEPQAKGRGFM